MFDPFNGKGDLENGLINFIGDTDTRVKEDYLRILRYLRFFANYSKQPHNPDVIRKLKTNISGVLKLSKERLLDELKKIVDLETLEKITKNKISLSLFQLIFPELKNINIFSKLNSELKEKKRPQIVAAIAEARSHGDLKENAEYHAAKEEQSHNEGRITEINDIIARANIIDVTKLNNDGKVIFGSTVFLENLDTGEKINYKIVGKDEADLKQKLIYFQSPIGKGLIGKNKNDLVEINTPAGVKNFEIKDVKYI